MAVSGHVQYAALRPDKSINWQKNVVVKAAGRWRCGNGRNIMKEKMQEKLHKNRAA